VGLGHSLRKDSGVLRVEEEVDSCQLDLLAGQVPLAAVHCPHLVPRFDQDSFPLAGAVFVLDETLSRNG